MTFHSFRILLPAIIAALSCAVLPACSRTDSIPGDEASGVISFRIKDGGDGILPLSRVTYDGVNTTLKAEKDIVGCVIATVNPDGTYEFVANTGWLYWYDGSLILEEQGYDASNNKINARQEIFQSTDNRQFIMKPGLDYAFFFYYPYHDPDSIKREIESLRINDYQIDIKKLSYPNQSETSNESNYVTNYHDAYGIFNDYIFTPFLGAVDDLDQPSDSEKFNYSSWTRFPVIPMIDYRSDNTDLSRLTNSDFMYAKVTTWNDMPINVTNTRGEINVTLVKQMATIDLCFSERPDNVLIRPKQDNNWKYSMPRRKDFDLSAGKFLNGDYTSQYNEWGNNLQRSASYGSPIYPKYMGVSREWTSSGDTDFYVYRLIMTPQDNLNCNVEMTINGKQYTLENLQKNPRLSSLKGGTYYKIRFSRTGDDTGWHLEIDDWKDGGSSFLDRP
ncbi:MAG: fimbrillin family protein [Muribaculaceae bacterium]|nr:fimbrillin family protein [Muribaculaceae bacterium]